MAELPAAKQRKVADTNGRLLHDTAQMAHLSCVGQKAMDDVIRQNVEQETENSVNDVSGVFPGQPGPPWDKPAESSPN